MAKFLRTIVLQAIFIFFFSLLFQVFLNDSVVFTVLKAVTIYSGKIRVKKIAIINANLTLEYLFIN